jgi:uncharacterized protein (TIGR03067 family)
MHLRSLTLLAALSGLAFAPAPLPREKKGNKAPKRSPTLEGTWSLVSLSLAGKASPRKVELKVHISNGRWAFVNNSRETEYEMVIDVNANPKPIDLRRPGAPMPAIRAIWELEGDTLRVAYFPGRLDGAIRPASFDMAQPRLVLMTLRKEL